MPNNLFMGELMRSVISSTSAKLLAPVSMAPSTVRSSARKAVAVTVYGIAPGAETAWAGRASTTPRPARSAVLSG